jgi:hypothetical protein
MTFDQIRLEIKYLSDSMTIQNNQNNLIKMFCSDVISRKEITKVEVKVYTQQGRNTPIALLDWTEMDGTLDPIYKYILQPDAWTVSEEGRLDVRVTYHDGTTQIETLPYKFEIKD